MSILSELWKRIKGGKTDSELAFGVLVATLGGKQRESLWQTLSAVQFAVTIANRHVQDPRIDTAKVWVNGALDILEARK